MTLTAVELAQMRTDIETLLPDTCNLLTATNTSDGQGGYTQAWGTAASGVACRLDEIRSRETLAGAALRPTGQYMLSLPHSATITAAYRVEHGGLTYAVVGLNTDVSWRAVQRATLEKVEI